MDSDGGRSAGRAAKAFCDWLARRAAGEEIAFEELCAQHASLAPELRAFRALAASDDPGPGPTLSARLTQRFGRAADPRVALDPLEEETGGPASDFSSEILDALARRPGAFARYSLKGEIARGGQGAVLRVWDEDLRRALAMKVLLGSFGDPSRVEPDARSLGRFLEEAQVTGQLEHPGIVPVHELGLAADGRVYFTMKLVKGETFKAVLEHVAYGEEGWSRARALSVLQRVCEAMSYAHHKGVVHRDLKPGNVMVGRFGEVYVMDWGLAKVLGRADAKDVSIAPRAATTELHADLRGRGLAPPDAPLLTMDGDVVGTPAYMPPEQALGRNDDIGAHSDVYALGAMLYHLLSGHMPYVRPGMGASNHETWCMVQQGPPEPIAVRAPDAPAELVAICERAMAREIGERYPDMQALSADLTAFLEHRVVSAYEAGAWAEAKKWVQRNKPLASALAAALALLVAGLATSLVFKAHAEEQARIATARADDVLRLSAAQDLEDLLARADALWPAHAENVELYEDWIEAARALADGVEVQRAKRDELRAHASPQTEDERRAERASHPRLSELAQLERELDSKRAVLAQRRGGLARELPAPDWSAFPSDARGLHAAAWARVRLDRDVDGDEALGLALAERALELAESDAQRAEIGSTASWAYFALGRDDEAMDASYRALEGAPAEAKTVHEEQLGELERAVAQASSAEGLAQAAEEIEALAARCRELEALVSERRDWTFPAEEPEARWWSNQLSQLIAGLEELESGLLAEDVVTEAHGWSVPKRLAFARRLRDGFAPGGESARAWERDLPAIHAAYPGLALRPQMGLEPIGADPASGLWEFAHLGSGEAAQRAADGKLELREATGIVLVLVPAGTFRMGAQPDDPRGSNYDPEAREDELPVHEVELSAYFLSKYEMTQGQWMRTTGRNPSRDDEKNYIAGWNRAGLPWSALHPVESVSWHECTAMMERLALALPTEAQWEYACRAGTTTPYSAGQVGPHLKDFVNLADQYANQNGGHFGAWEAWDDGNSGHARIGSYLPNAFGVHEMHGNVWECCADEYVQDFFSISPRKDPVAPTRERAACVMRGGSFDDLVVNLRSANRTHYTPVGRMSVLGLRPARAVVP